MSYGSCGSSRSVDGRLSYNPLSTPPDEDDDSGIDDDLYRQIPSFVLIHDPNSALRIG